MLINLKIPQIMPYRAKFTPAQSSIPFCANDASKGDEFVSSIELSENSKLTKAQCQSILSQIKKTDPSGCGTKAAFYNIGQFGVKKQNADTALKEEFALNYLAQYGIKNIPTPVACFKNNADCYLVTDVMSGKHYDIDNNIRLNDKHIAKIIDTCEKMDNAAFVDYDWHVGNILFDSDNVNIIDFGSYSVLPDDIKWPLSVYDNTLDELKNNTITNPKRRIGLNQKITRGYDYNSSDNPFLYLPSNLANFEYRFLSTYLKKLEQKDPKEAKEIFASFLKQKSGYVMRRLKNNDLMSEIIKNTPDDNFLRGIECEKAKAKVLRNPSDTVIKIEKAKMDLKSAQFELMFNNNKALIEQQKQSLQNLRDAVEFLLKNNSSQDEYIYAKMHETIYFGKDALK